jgi:hypothetical protein
MALGGIKWFWSGLMGINRSFHDFNELLLILFFIWLWPKVNSTSLTIKVLAASTIACSVFLLVPFLSSTSVDLPVALLVWLAFWLTIEALKNQNEKFEWLFLASLISIFSITIKASGIVWLLYPALLGLWFLVEKRSIKFRWLLLAGLIIIAPWLWRNIQLTGFVLYPVSSIDLLDVDWKTAPQITQKTEQEVTLFAVFGSKLTTDLYVDFEKAKAMGLIERMPYWWHVGLGSEKYLIIASILLLLIAVAFTITKRAYLLSLVQANAIWPVISIALAIIVGIVFWFIKAPAPRFGLAYLGPIWFIGLAGFFYLCAHYISIKHVLIRLVISLAFCALCFVKGFDSRPLKSYQFLPPPYPTVQYFSYKVGHLTINQPSSDIATGVEHACDTKEFFCTQCWDTPLPCAIHLMHNNIEPRGKKIEDGFRPTKGAHIIW